MLREHSAEGGTDFFDRFHKLPTKSLQKNLSNTTEIVTLTSETLEQKGSGAANSSVLPHTGTVTEGIRGSARGGGRSGHLRSLGTLVACEPPSSCSRLQVPAMPRHRCWVAYPDRADAAVLPNAARQGKGGSGISDTPPSQDARLQGTLVSGCPWPLRPRSVCATYLHIPPCYTSVQVVSLQASAMIRRS